MFDVSVALSPKKLAFQAVADYKTVMESQWYYTVQGQQQGPVPESELRSLIQSGQVAGNEFVFKEGMPDWAVVTACPELAGAPVPLSPPASSAGVYMAPAGSGITVGTIYSEAFEIFKTGWLPLSLATLIIFFCNFGVFFVFLFIPPQLAILRDLISIAVFGPLTLGMWGMYVNAVDRRPVELGQLFEGFQRFVPACVLEAILSSPFIFASLVTLVSIELGGLIGLLMLFPFLLVVILLVFAFPSLADGMVSPIDAIKKSFTTVKDNPVVVLPVVLLGIPIIIAGLCAAFIGVFPATAFWGLTVAVAYRWLNPPVPAG